ncbi:hypothetical protein F4778DRAFT_761173 [Xylariomycetidae sp. FL2044]|nr:hypothetical protein F4778DRAFT_761173 [Xylariomycetidae sp. FL2044]
MSALLSHITGWKNSPGPDGNVNGEHSAASASRGVKRKAKADPYEDMDQEDAPQQTPSTQPRKRGRPSLNPPSSATKTPSTTGKKLRGRPSKARVEDALQDSRVDASSNLVRANASDAARLHVEPENARPSGSTAPVADMGISDPLPTENADEVTDEPARPKSSTSATPTNKGKGKAKAVAEEVQADEAGEKNEEEDDREELEIDALLGHRFAKDGTNRVELQVQWVGESRADATWEAEEEIQQSADETLYAYWKSQGGRSNALFFKPTNAPPEVYHVFKVLRHEKKNRGGFQFEVQWVGHPPIRGETSMESEQKLKNAAPELLEQYWESKGGRDKHLAKRGRNHKN